MAEGVQVAAFEGGQLRTLASGDASREAVLALPLSRLLVKMVRVPKSGPSGAEQSEAAADREDPVAFCTPVLQAMSPYPDEPLTVSFETVREDAGGQIVIAAALPESATDDIGEALDGAKLNVTRIDVLAIGALRGLWNGLGTDDGARRLVLINGTDCISAIVLDGDGPSAIRAVSATSVIRREIMLLLLEAEDFGGAKPLKEIVLVESPTFRAQGADDESLGVGPSTLDLGPLQAFAPVRKVEIGDDAALVGVAERTDDPGALNALPESWREMLDESRFKAKMIRYLAVAAGVWLLLMGVVFGVPFAFGLMTDHQKQLCREHKRQFDAVSEMKSKVELVQKYSDHDRGSLEIMKAVSDRLPAGITLNNWSFRREEGVKVSGEADDANAVYEFKDAMDAILVTDETGEEVRLFPTVKLNGPTASKGKQKFDLECLYERENDE